MLKPLTAAAVVTLAFGSLVAPAHAQPPSQEPAPAEARRAPSAPPDVASPPNDAVKTASGLAWKVIEPGTGDRHPASSDIVTVQYTGWTTDGRVFDSTYLRGKPSTFGLDRVLKGWTEGIQLMVVGEKRRVWVPEQLAFKGMKDKPQGMLVFDVELLGIEQSPLTAPADVAEPPADAARTRSGLAYRVIRPGTGSEHPAARSKVTVHYTGWTTDGKAFDSSVSRGRPATFALDQVIRGWTEGVQLMVVGEKTRFWIPQRLAYDGQSGGPRGMLVFDIELIAIER